MVELRKVDASNIWKIIKLSVAVDQLNFVATNTESLLEAYTTVIEGRVALPFGIYKDGVPVGFVMFGYDSTGDADEPEVAAGNYCLWRLMIDKAYQRQGLGTSAMKEALAYLRGRPCGPADYCWLSYDPNNFRAQAIFSAMGFTENGETCCGETVSVLKL